MVSLGSSGESKREGEEEEESLPLSRSGIWLGSRSLWRLVPVLKLTYIFESSRWVKFDKERYRRELARHKGVRMYRWKVVDVSNEPPLDQKIEADARK